ncbi:MAG: chemotaxis protein CheX [Deltaproteobacteria bacterium]|nr:chemotaxis protein CheX [Deltaproteobacteria bacterium]
MGVKFFGQFLLEQKIISAPQLVEAVEYQQAQNLKLGDYAVKKGYLTREQSAQINRLQQQKDLKFGQAAVDLNLLTAKQVDELLLMQQNDHIYLGDAVVLKGFAARDVVDKALAAFKEDQKVYDTAGGIPVPSELQVTDTVRVFVDMTQKMLLRMGGVETKVMGNEWITGSVMPPGKASLIRFEGGIRTSYILGLPEAVTATIGLKLLGSMFDPNDPVALQDSVQEFCNIVTGNVVARLAQMGVRSEILPPDVISGPISLGTGRALKYNLATPDGHQVLLALVL